jgi:hypothetical protein
MGSWSPLELGSLRGLCRHVIVKEVSDFAILNVPRDSPRYRSFHNKVLSKLHLLPSNEANLLLRQLHGRAHELATV